MNLPKVSYDPSQSIPGTEFKYDWTTKTLPVFESFVPKGLGDILEIGCWEGRTSCYLVEKHLREGGQFVGVDPHSYDDARSFAGADEYRTNQSHDVWNEENVAAVKERCRVNFNVIQEFFNRQEIIFAPVSSATYLTTAASHRLRAYKFRLAQPPFELIFIDGSHLLADVTLDLFLSMQLVKPGSIIVVDDYPKWQVDPNDSGFHDPKSFEEDCVGTAVDHFRDAFTKRIEVLHDTAPAFVCKVTK